MIAVGRSGVVQTLLKGANMKLMQWLAVNRRVGSIARLLAGVVLVGGVAGMAQYAGRPTGDEKPLTPPVEPTSSATILGGPAKKKYSADELRKRYPFESLSNRLEYEVRRADRDRSSPADSELTEGTEKRLKTMESGYGRTGPWRNLRIESLKLLHSSEVEKFIAREGFGMERMPSPKPSYLDLPTAPPIPITASGARIMPPEPGPQVVLAQREGARVAGSDGTDLAMPTFPQLDLFHLRGQYNFVEPGSLGYIKDRDHVAGFQAHQFRSMPEVDDARGRGEKPPKEKWAVGRLELVSLLKHERPAVYVSTELPRMEQLKKAKTRPLDEFEAEALKRLQKGEDVVADAAVNQIRLVGSLRAAEQCRECHSVSRGALLGAFTYELQRVPPRKTDR
jgi:hypothetical protein